MAVGGRWIHSPERSTRSAAMGELVGVATGHPLLALVPLLITTPSALR